MSILALVILGLTLRLIYLITRKVVLGRRIVERKRRVNYLVTIAHILIFLSFTFMQAYLIPQPANKNKNSPNYDHAVAKEVRKNTAFVFFAGISDLFLSLMLWLIVQDKQKRTLVVADSIAV